MTETREQIEIAICDRFAKLAIAPDREQRFEVGPGSAKRLGYSADVIDALPDLLTAPFAGVGNPFTLGEIGPGLTVLDLGCGAGMDSVIAAGLGAAVIGVDLVDEMLERAAAGARAAGATGIEWRKGRADALPAADGSVDVLISNGVFNLCFDKPAVVAEMYRVLKPGGRVQMADIVLEPHVTPEELAGKGTWSD